ncbi:hypothetical protein H1C71_041029, partial [Ictidomys tridecemlineatus]
PGTQGQMIPQQGSNWLLEKGGHGLQLNKARRKPEPPSASRLPPGPAHHAMPFPQPLQGGRSSAPRPARRERDSYCQPTPDVPAHRGGNGPYRHPPVGEGDPPGVVLGVKWVLGAPGYSWTRRGTGTKNAQTDDFVTPQVCHRATSGTNQKNPCFCAYFL